MRAYIKYYLLFILLVSGCKFFNSPDYKIINSDLSLKLIEIGDSQQKIEAEKYLWIDFSYNTMFDSVFYRGSAKFLYEDENDLLIAPALELLSGGDSASLLVNAEKYFHLTLKSPVPEFLRNNEKMKINLRIIQVQSFEEYQEEKEIFLNWLTEFNRTEADRIKDYLNQKNINISPTQSGLYFIPLRSGTGPKVVKGRTISIHYQSRFLDGKFVEDTYEDNEPLQFVYGTDYFVIKGLEEALSRMREGDKALVIVPSDLAFGAFGSARGIVPPYTTMIYELEVLKVQ